MRCMPVVSDLVVVRHRGMHTKHGGAGKEWAKFICTFAINEFIWIAVCYFQSHLLSIVVMFLEILALVLRIVYCAS